MSGIDTQKFVSDLAGHVKDTNSFHFPFWHPEIPEFLTQFGITRFVIIELAVLAVMAAIFVPLAMKIRDGKPVKGRFWNMIELMLVYLKEQVIEPSIGKKSAAPFIPYLWGLFFFVLLCNLAGMVPWAGSPTGSLSITVVLALATFAIVVFTGMKRHGAGGYWLGLIPPVDLPWPLGYILKPMLFVIEIVSLLIKHSVLAIRLMANMFAGHLTLAVFLAFISFTAGALLLWIPVTAGSIGLSVAISLLELLVAFLQAYIFTLLSAIYIGMSVHQH